jgi:DNA-binding Lrp family transcriptional regulator
MSVRAYVLIQTELGHAQKVTDSIRCIPGFVGAEDVTGPYDIIAQAEADSVDDLSRIVICRLQLVDGITRTLTCPIVEV